MGMGSLGSGTEAVKDKREAWAALVCALKSMERIGLDGSQLGGWVKHK